MLLDFVRPTQGTRSHFAFSHGNCLPLVAMPWGMTHFCPQTDESGWAFAYDSRKLQGIRATHLPSPWMGDYGHLTIFPFSGDAPVAAQARSSAYRRDEATFRPDYFAADLVRYGVRVELTPTERGCAIRCTFPANAAGGLLLQPFAGPSGAQIDPAGGVALFTSANSGGAPADFACHYAVRCDAPFAAWAIAEGDERRDSEMSAEGDRIGARLTFAPHPEPLTVTVQIATSFISAQQAEANRLSELDGRTFDSLRAAAAARWESLLGRITIDGGSERQCQTFYTCLYRALLFPRMFHERDAAGRTVHYDPFGERGGVRDGPLFTDNGFWDTYRTVYPLLALVYPDALAEIMQGLTNAARNGGWLPTWASPGYRACMVGTHLDVVIADAYLRGVTDFDIETTYAAALRDCDEEGPEHGRWGRKGLTSFIERGFVAADQDEHAAARTQEYAYTDYCVATLAEALGKTDDAARLLPRAQYYRNTFDPSAGFMRGRRADGTWLPFDPIAWDTAAYIEGSAWQYTWQVPHDVPGLIALMGGGEAFVAKLDELLATPPRFDVGGYGFEIHEMTEMAEANFGQYAHSNQPVHHVLYLYTVAGRPDLTQRHVRRVLDELYSPEPDGLPGDEDNGEMSAWYVLSALGLFPLCPGRPDFTIGTPLFPAATIALRNGRQLRLVATNHRPDAPVVSAALLDGQPIADWTVSHAAVAAGGTITFVMAE